MEGVSSQSMAEVGTRSSVISPLLICMLGIVVTTIAILTYHLILVKYCIRRRYAPNTAAAQLAAAPRTATGVDDKILEAVPILAFSVIKRGNDQGEECVVCLGELEDEDAVRLLPNCNHAFHVSCIDQWFAAHATCPLCRSPVLRQEADAAPASPDLVEVPNFSGSGHDNATNGSDEPPPPPRGQSIGLLRPCASLSAPIAPPMDQTSWWRLKRSLSMDLSLVVVIDLDRAQCSSATSFSSSSRVIRRSGSLSHFDRAPSKWLRSFSWLRTGKVSNGAILPY